MRFPHLILTLKWIWDKYLKESHFQYLVLSLEILVGAQDCAVEDYLDDGDPIMQQIPLLPGNFTSHTIVNLLANHSSFSYLL